jgi:hypothetical protein
VVAGGVFGIVVQGKALLEALEHPFCPVAAVGEYEGAPVLQNKVVEKLV